MRTWPGIRAPGDRAATHLLIRRGMGVRRAIIADLFERVRLPAARRFGKVVGDWVLPTNPVRWNSLAMLFHR